MTQNKLSDGLEQSLQNTDIDFAAAAVAHDDQRRKILIGGALSAIVVGSPTRSIAQSGTVLRVGPTQTYKTVADASRVARDGDTVEIDAGIYAGDVAYWGQHNLRIRSSGGIVQMVANGASYGGKGIWVIGGNNVSVDGIQFVGAKVPDMNGAGIRHEGSGLTVMNCRFTECENGILAGDKAGSEVLVERCYFERCGFGDGRSHGLYYGAHARLTVRYCVFRDTKVGHHIKSRALQTVVEYCSLADLTRGSSSSYCVDASNGGDLILLGNLIEEGAGSENSGTVAFGMEGMRAASKLTMIHNTFVNDRASVGVVLRIQNNPNLSALTVLNNVVTGAPSTWLNVDALTPASKLVENNYTVPRTSFADSVNLDYRFRSNLAPTGPITTITDPTLVPRGEPAPIQPGTAMPSTPRLPGAYQNMLTVAPVYRPRG